MANQRLEEIADKVTEEIWNKGNVDALEECFDENVTTRLPGAEFKGLDGYKKFLGIYREAFPDLHVEKVQYYSDGDRGALEWVFNGTHQGPLMGIEPSGKSIRLHGVTASRYENDKIVEETFYWDRLEQFQALGVDLDQVKQMLS